MEITILEERPNPLLKRHEYRFEVAHATAATPSRDSVRGELSKLVKAPKERVIIERMSARFGTATTRGDAIVYETAEAAKSITRAHILVRNGLKEKPAEGTAPPSPVPEVAKPAVTHEAPKAEPTKEGAHSPGPEPKAEHKGEPKAEHKGEPKAELKGEPKVETHKGEHRAKTPKAEKGTAPAKAE
jgi:small subunit ribosomal protein S24e